VKVGWKEGVGGVRGVLPQTGVDGVQPTTGGFGDVHLSSSQEVFPETRNHYSG
jgi:hypothetical protein